MNTKTILFLEFECLNVFDMLVSTALGHCLHFGVCKKQGVVYIYSSLYEKPNNNEENIHENISQKRNRKDV